MTNSKQIFSIQLNSFSIIKYIHKISHHTCFIRSHAIFLNVVSHLPAVFFYPSSLLSACTVPSLLWWRRSPPRPSFRALDLRAACRHPRDRHPRVLSIPRVSTTQSHAGPRIRGNAGQCSSIPRELAVTNTRRTR
jgi:hypothetical protein